VHNCWDLDWREVVVPESSPLGFRPCKCLLVDFEDVRHKLHLFGPQKVKPVEVEGIEAFLGEARAQCELGRVCRKCGKGEEGILGTASNDTKVFREGSGNWVVLRSRQDTYLMVMTTRVSGN